MELRQIGTIQAEAGNPCLVLDKSYISALTGLEGFSHLNILWWFSGCDSQQYRESLTEQSPYKKSPSILGTFATRSPARPNPIALSCVGITYIDYENGVVGLTYIDADNASPVLDIKPYTPSLDRVENPRVPDWCSHWPKCCEESGDFDWENEFNF